MEQHPPFPAFREGLTAAWPERDLKLGERVLAGGSQDHERLCEGWPIC